MATKFSTDVTPGPAYADDLAAWSFHQAMLLRSGQLHLLDRAWIAEELEDLGHEQYDRMESALRLILSHLLKWDIQVGRRSRSWTTTIRAQRKAVAKQLAKNPSLASRRDEAVHEAYDDARGEASAETDLPLKTFPANCPYSWDEIVARPVSWPDDE